MIIAGLCHNFAIVVGGMCAKIRQNVRKNAGIGLGLRGCGCCDLRKKINSVGRFSLPTEL